MYYSPVENYITRVEQSKFTRYLEHIVKHKSELRVDHDCFLSEWDKTQISIPQCWLIVNENAPKYLESSQIYNIFLLSVWTLSPTNFYIMNSGVNFGKNFKGEKL